MKRTDSATNANNTASAVTPFLNFGNALIDTLVTNVSTIQSPQTRQNLIRHGQKRPQNPYSTDKHLSLIGLTSSHLG